MDRVPCVVCQLPQCPLASAYALGEAGGGGTTAQGEGAVSTYRTTHGCVVGMFPGDGGISAVKKMHEVLGHRGQILEPPAISWAPLAGLEGPGPWQAANLVESQTVTHNLTEPA